MLFSVKMRSSEGATHEAGGRHISGAERLVNADEISSTVQELLSRARTHERGVADFINIKVAARPHDTIIEKPLLQIVDSPICNTLADSKQYATDKLLANGLSPTVIEAVFAFLNSLDTSMRGAALLSASTGKLIDLIDNKRGVRVTNMGAHNPPAYTDWLAKHNLHGDHPAEAILLASKVASAPFVVSEICWSDDPCYTVGYVSDTEHYYRITNFKPLGNDVGGRVFVVDDTAENFSLDELLHYLQEQVVLLTLPT